MSDIFGNFECTIYIVLLGLVKLIPIQLCLIICKSKVEPGFEGRRIPKVGKSCESIVVDKQQNSH
ncbi:hypothetical protein Tcan_13625 [Toxocara canis]|uniref:Uncharacterized protein n=1 Tax=Toxocara canis TaxID=6265 RepID=A0A0B2VS87_TOXCA|nr:hypothetical protein Tcan_13625 [Toxocara canis]